MMNKVTYVSMLSLAMFLVACGDKEDATNVPNNAPVQKENSSGPDKTNDIPDYLYEFTHFDLNVDYPNNKSFDVNYESESTGSEAQIEDDLNNRVIQGNDAVDELVPIFESFTFDQSTADADVIQEVLKAFNLQDDFLKFELEIKYTDNVEKEYHQHK